MKRFAFVAAIAASAALALAPVAAASWDQQNTAVLGGASTSQFSAVSCSSGACMAVGGFTGGGGSGLLAESRSGSTWTVQTPPNVTGNAESLSAVSCPAPSVTCIAVGSYFNGADTVTLAELWNGTSWTVQSPPNPAGASSTQLSDIACTSATACIAAGQSSNGTTTTTFAELWNGTSWNIQSTPNPAGAKNSVLLGIECTSATACIAVGDSSGATNTTTLAEAWNGSSWKIQSTPNPTGSTFTQLEDVSCSSASACTAVGSGLAERWDGTSWTLQKIAFPGPGTNLSAVSCTAPTSCTAVGTYFQDAVLQAVAEAWNGHWSVQATPISTSFDSSSLSDVSCVSPVSCTAVGSYHDPTTGDRALVEFSSLKWQVQSATIPSGAISSDLAGVSCNSLTVCKAVGNFETASDFQTVAEGWDGTHWNLDTTPNPSISNLSGVSCWSGSACTAVGDFSSGGTLMTLAERWNGTSWSTQATPNPPGATKSFLLAVSCPTATACTAVGFYVNGSGKQLTLAETWNGTSWTIQSTPNPTGTTIPQLNSVSCTSATACTAVGAANTGSYQMLAENWNGTSWTIKATPNPSGGSDSYLSGVSCSASNACTAVGSYFDGSHTVSLAESWNGSGWSSQSTVTPGGATASGLSSVSCVPGVCIAVGFYRHGRLFGLSERWGGSWKLVNAAIPPGSQGFDLVSVSCRSVFGYGCTAVGYVIDGSSIDDVLAEQYS